MYDKIYTYPEPGKQLEQQDDEKVKLGFKDILALIIAAYQVVLVPFAILVLSFVILFLLFKLIWGA